MSLTKSVLTVILSKSSANTTILAVDGADDAVNAFDTKVKLFDVSGVIVKASPSYLPPGAFFIFG